MCSKEQEGESSIERIISLKNTLQEEMKRKKEEERRNKRMIPLSEASDGASFYQAILRILRVSSRIQLQLVTLHY